MMVEVCRHCTTEYNEQNCGANWMKLHPRGSLRSRKNWVRLDQRVWVHLPMVQRPLGHLSVEVTDHLVRVFWNDRSQRTNMIKINDLVQEIPLVVLFF